MRDFIKHMSESINETDEKRVFDRYYDLLNQGLSPDAAIDKMAEEENEGDPEATKAFIVKALAQQFTPDTTEEEETQDEPTVEARKLLKAFEEHSDPVNEEELDADKKAKINKLIDELAEDFKPYVEKIEKRPMTTKGHYGDYMSLLASLGADKQNRKLFAIALLRAGANSEGIKGAMMAMGSAMESKVNEKEVRPGDDYRSYMSKSERDYEDFGVDGTESNLDKKWIDNCVELVKKDILANPELATAKRFEDLHDIVDANTLGNMEDALDYFENTEIAFTHLNEVTRIVDEWMQQRSNGGE